MLEDIVFTCSCGQCERTLTYTADDGVLELTDIDRAGGDPEEYSVKADVDGECVLLFESELMVVLRDRRHNEMGIFLTVQDFARVKAWTEGVRDGVA